MANTGLNQAAMERCRQQLAMLAVPPGSLGRLESYAVRLAGIRGRVGGRLRNKAVLVFAADSGCEAPEESGPLATARRCERIGAGQAAVSALAGTVGARVCVYDIGIRERAVSGEVRDWNIVRGSREIGRGPAMTRTEFDAAFAAGRNAVAENGTCDVFGIGAIGDGNAAAAAAVAAVLLGMPPEETVGDAWSSREEREAMAETVRQAVEVNRPDPADAREVVTRIGGLDLAAMAGAYLECTKRRRPAVIDGGISACAALVACRLRPQAADFLFASQQSTEPYFGTIMNEIGLVPPLSLDMHIGEGSACPFMFDILDGALAVVEETALLEAPDSDESGE
ncbi:MAG: nicotinate-nucleotide--dimethylbenzimidazole phosphoribosyltransferase [Clostridia bacterium]|nr:nicotinate-nucleotide--dimethylbenzimidazole phosphoribosyltransferase [Clostridia bacterium]